MTDMTIEDLRQQRDIARTRLADAVRGAVFALTENEVETLAAGLLQIPGLSNSAPGRALADAAALWRNVAEAIGAVRE